MPAAREYAPWSKGAVLLVDPPIVVTADVARARPDAAQLPGGVAWHVAVELHPEAAARFDAAATRLYSLNPPGMVAIVVDGRIVSMPSIRSDKFGGNLVIAGAKDQDECRTWAFALSGGELPCLLRELDVRNYRGKLRR
jgi:preprotein translocase subunit SecD